MTLPQTALMIQEFLDEYEAIAGWDTLRTERTHTVLPMILEHVEGDILEIGAHSGGTTKVFCELGDKYNRHVHVVDPWDGRQQGNAEAHGQFQAVCSEYKNLTVHRLGSEDPAVLEALKEKGVRFSYILIDGLHSYDAVKNDLLLYKDLLTLHGVICIDDWQGPYAFSNDIRDAAHDHLDDSYKELTVPESFIETYFVRLS
jgi:hypothetical protein